MAKVIQKRGDNRLAYIATYKHGLKEGPLVLYGENGRIKARLHYHRDVLQDTTVLFGKRRQAVTYKIYDQGTLQHIIHLDDHEQPFLTFRVLQDTLPLLRGTYKTVDNRKKLCLKDGAYTFSDGQNQYEGECLFDYPYDLSLVHGGDTITYKIRYYSAKRIMLETFEERAGLLQESFDGICLEGG